jgi:hypothetical protein
MCRVVVYRQGIPVSLEQETTFELCVEDGGNSGSDEGKVTKKTGTVLDDQNKL